MSKVKHRSPRTPKSCQAKESLDSFAQLQDAYGLTDPTQIQMKILWFHLQQLVGVAFPGVENEVMLRKYDRHWKVCEETIKKNQFAKQNYGTES